MTSQTRGFSSLVVLIIIVILGLGLLAYQKAEIAPVDFWKNALSDKVDVPTDWIRHEDPRGFRYAVPPNWYWENDSFSLYSPAHVYGNPSEEPNQSGGIKVVVLDELRVPEDPSSEYAYMIATKEWVHITCKDGSFETYCRNAKQVATTTITSNIEVGGIPGLKIRGENPQRYIIPINSKYGIIISLTARIDEKQDFEFVLTPTTQKILDSFNFFEPAS